MDYGEHRINENEAYTFPLGVNAIFIPAHGFEAMCEERGIENDPTDFAEVYDYDYVVAAKNNHNEDGWLCFY